MAALVALKSATAEDAMLELTEQLAGLQTDTTKNPNNVAVITAYSRNGLTGAVTVSFTLPVSSAPDSVTGLPKLNVTEVFS